ncbi:cysteine--tRNA ligase [Acetohalobium arabaticum]|uniref:Cysteine--tRNA ligase n=1 Tax=Acetohalobium arabaticum (strain ATCC 49924 / DSM 5501 / Z-7288) TaxID=574087 RepID=D9QT04_ACEAZ|nr:cysteine--tRNA ligase [Acetohalobium arabaticum]ADL11692.1 cysteinyl-tRNA synthetase [Acetohalobium arabaticum DSM 5501]
MTLQIYNTLTQKKEEFEPLDQDEVKLYSCGPTVYDYFHIGNARAFILPDILKRYLEYKGYNVLHVTNFTDVDDKMIKRANEEEIEIEELADRFITAYFEDTERLNIKQADVYPKATEHISDIIELVKKLEDKGYAYEVDGDVFFAVRKFADYGKLSNQELEELTSGSRVEVNDKKEDPLDFVLWKKSKEGEPSWESPWGTGRPGWHIECSAMSMCYLGEEFDFHTGGVDLVFPHHENEIAQNEAGVGSQVVNYWLHNGYINVDGEKMSKSLGNFFTTRDILQDYSAEVLRFFLISKHYRSPINFSDAELDNAAKSLQRLQNTVNKLKDLLDRDRADLKPGNKEELQELEKKIKAKREKFEEAMDDDLNTALAIGALHELAKELNIVVNDADFELNQANIIVLEKAYDTFKELSQQVLGINLETEDDISDNLTSDLIGLLLEVRNKARQNQDWELADQIRDELSELGIILEDTPQGTDWKLE